MHQTRCAGRPWYDSSSFTVVERTPDNLHPATFTEDLILNGPLFQVNISHFIIPSPAAPPPDQITKHGFFQSVLGNLKRNLDFTDISASASSGTLLLSSDGSYDPHTHDCSYSWLLQTDNETYRGAGPVNGAPNYRNPYRAELYGILAGLYALFWSEQEAPITFWKSYHVL
jgi:hypothetical protein